MYISIFNSILHFFWLDTVLCFQNWKFLTTWSWVFVNDTGLFILIFMYTLTFNVNLAFLSCYGLAISQLKIFASWSYVFNCFVTSKHRSIHSAFMLFMCIYRFPKSTLPFCLDVMVVRFQEWNLGILVLSYKSSTVVCERHASISLYIQLSWEVSISRRCLEAWRILTLIESNSTGLCFLMVCEAWSLWNRTWPARFLEDGRISPQLVHLEGKRLLIIQNTLPCAKLEVYRIWRSYQQGHRTSNRSICSHKFN